MPPDGDPRCRVHREPFADPPSKRPTVNYTSE